MNKRISRWTLLMVLISISIISMGHSAAPNPRVVSVTFDGLGLFAWAKRGTLMALEIKHGQGMWYLYHSTKGDLLVITNTPSHATTMIAEQLDNADESKRFVQRYLPDVAVSFFGSPHPYLIDEIYIKNRASLPAGAWWQAPDKDAVERSAQILERYQSKIQPVIENNDWELLVYVTSLDGSVEKWSLDGAVYPFSIRHVEKTVCEKPGTIVPMPEVGAKPEGQALGFGVDGCG